MRSTAEAVVRWTLEGFHSWPEACGKRAYLASCHRHLFHFEARLELRHDERDVEFHDMLQELRGLWPQSHDFGSSSCETIARATAQHIAGAWPGRKCSVAVFEDGEVGAQVTLWPEGEV